ncbi:unnamed protein product [Orchesella dallaii]|uniref:Gustatory receptor n=1 Tax=Orchesella dallaii TaxID=48710 RepID=A0ABP1QTR5_9HEXA
MESAVTPLIHLSFEIYNATYKFWLPYFLQFDLSSGVIRLKLVNNHLHLAPWYAVQFFIFFLTGIGSVAYVLIYELFLSPIRTIQIVNLFMILWGGLILSLLFTLLLITRNHHKNLSAAFNRTLEEEKAIITAIKTVSTSSRNRKQPRHYSILEFLFCTVPLGASVLMIFSIFFLVPLDIDPICYIAQQHILPHPYFHTQVQIITSYLIRLVLGMIFSIELCRLTTNTGLILVTAGLVANSILSKLELGLLSSRRLIIHYIRLRIIWHTVNWVSDSVNFVGVVAGQVITTLTICFGIRAWDKFPLFLSFLFTTCAFGFLCTSVIFLSLIGHAAEKVERFIESNRQRAFAQVGKNAISYKRWKAQQPAKIHCGSFFAFKKRTIFTYLEVLLNNVINGLLIVQ